MTCVGHNVQLLRHYATVRPAALVGAVPSLAERNRVLAVDALLRNTSRALALLDAVQAGKIPAKLVNDDQRKRLLGNADEAVSKRASEVFSSGK